MVAIRTLPEYDGHARVVRIADKATGLLGYIAIHSGGTPHRPALGASRIWNYSSERAAARDALRLSRLMAYKSAIAGFRYGGAKAALIMPKGGIKDRKKFFEAYARKVNALKGAFITGTDVGVTGENVRMMKAITPYVIGSGLDPAYYTALGVVQGIRVMAGQVFGSRSLKGRSFAIQGLGKVGAMVLEMIARDASKLYIADIDPEKVAAYRKKFPRAIVRDPKTIHKEKVDVFVPCALGGTINARSVPEFQCRIIAGSANNQLATSADGRRLFARGIWYAPDYIINVGGFISVVDEFRHRGRSDKARIMKKVRHMETVLSEVLARAEKEHRSPDAVSDEIVEKFIKK